MESPTSTESDLLKQNEPSSVSRAHTDTSNSGSKGEIEKPEMLWQECYLISAVQRQGQGMLKKALQLLEDNEKKITAIQIDAALNRENISKAFQDLQDLIENEKNLRLNHSKNKEVEALQTLEARNMSLKSLKSSITDLLETLEWTKRKRASSRTKNQMKELSAQLEEIPDLKVELGGCVSSLQLKQWRGMRHFVKPVSESLHFDPMTAHPNLILSADLKRVRFHSYPQMVMANKNRFEPALYVLGLPVLHSGRHYWEVDVGHKSNWILGVVKESVNRKKEQDLSPMNGYWVLRKQMDFVYYGIGPKPQRLILRTSPMRIGITLDFFRGHLAFYDVDNSTMIFEFAECPVEENLYAFFCPGVPTREEDWCPLTLCT
ncbi:E3 ubiquitin-protein ligase TRIM11 [Bombina bombina]|uniref:E3 ubiquitin-protein ligase TRIM11 n=1 Tax=Bombina bombina TaxID=8345 RepID=UPI00235AC7C9|nr:E3 ubiquitin-protein ligase TRIM11 [Bombina bombina]XP_053554074.1 E3 ubiquitin-protein ligase TRIM11 [Bombina bombina]XP_053554082.1 E3 ubiquitin-protein ligase TRIM11 [Bombina bombina]XP_053554091.1 E3 ubiquitin-protein ligase TRIM11 [Bombina bombina]